MTARLLTVLTTLLAVSAAPTKRWTTTSSKCITFYQNITAQANNLAIGDVVGPIPQTQEELVQGAVDQYAASSTIQADLLKTRLVPMEATYQLYFEYCEPIQGSPKGVYQTTHGLVGTAGYWNVLVDNVTDYSFTESATAAGWAVLNYDRLGVGHSDHPNGRDVVQIPLEISQSIEIATLLRSGQLHDAIPSYSTVVGIGHSYGSNVMCGVASQGPDTFDIIVITGLSANATEAALLPLGQPGFGRTIASIAYPDRFQGLGGDYVVTGTTSNDQQGFFHYPNFTSTALEYFTATKGEYSLGQFYTFPHPYGLDRKNYTKPTYVIVGSGDGPFCGGNCYVTSLGPNATTPDTLRPFFPSVPDNQWEVKIVPDTGHGINYHTTAYGAYQDILAWVTAHL